MSLDVEMLYGDIIHIGDINPNMNMEVELIMNAEGFSNAGYINKQQAYAIINELKKQFGENDE